MDGLSGRLMLWLQAENIWRHNSSCLWQTRWHILTIVCNDSASWPWHIFSHFMMRCSVLLCYCRAEAKDNPGTARCSGVRCLSVWPPWPLPVSSSAWDPFLTVLIGFQGPHLSPLCWTVNKPALISSDCTINLHSQLHLAVLRHYHAGGNLVSEYLNSVIWVWRWSDRLLAPKRCLCWLICPSTKQERVLRTSPCP